MQRTRKEFSEIAGLVIALNRREDQLDRPLGGHALGFERIGQPQPANHQIGLQGPAAIKLALDMLPFRQRDRIRQQCQLTRQMLPVQIGRTDFGEGHLQLA